MHKYAIGSMLSVNIPFQRNQVLYQVTILARRFSGIYRPLVLSESTTNNSIRSITSASSSGISTISTISTSSPISSPTSQTKASNLAILPNLKRALSRSLTTATTKTPSKDMATPQKMKITTRPSSTRGHADHGWLKTFHTFSFASYYSPNHTSLGPLRVLNEDRVDPGTGFGTHAHKEFLIWSYIVKGELEHKDSLGNLETLKRGDVQFTNAGTGVRHSEFNRNKEVGNHFLQIWAKPAVKGLAPKYITRRFGDEEKRGKLVKIMEFEERTKEESGAIPLCADLDMYASILSPSEKVVYEPLEGDRRLYVHVVMSKEQSPKEGGGKVRIGDVVVGEGDGALVEFPESKVEIESVGEKDVEFLLFDLGRDDD